MPPRLPLADLKFATEVTYQRKMSDWTTQQPTTNAAPALAHFFGRRSRGAKRTSTPKPTVIAATAPNQRAIAIGTCQPPRERFPTAATRRNAPSRHAVRTTAIAMASGKRIHHGLSSGASSIRLKALMQARTAPDTSQIASTAAKATRPPLEPEKIFCTVAFAPP